MISTVYLKKFEDNDLSEASMVDIVLGYEKKRKYKLQYIPLSMTDIKYPNFNYNNRNINRDLLYTITNIIIFTYYRQRENLIILNAQLLRNKLGRNYQSYIEYLIDNKIIELIKNYSAGHSSRSYKICDDIIKNKQIRRVKNYQLDISLIEEKFSVMDSSHNYIKESVKKRLISDLYKIDINTKQATIDIITSDIFLQNHMDDELNIHDAYNWLIGNIDKIANREIFYKCDAYGRLHSNFTNLKSNIRQTSLTIYGNKTCEFDIPNSQPMFLLLFLKKYINDIDILEYNNLKSMVLSETLYDDLGKLWTMVDKKTVKKQLFSILYGEVKYSAKNIPLKQFKTMFPTIFNFINKYKKQNKNYKIVAHELQRMESDFIYNNVVSEIYDISPTIVLFTVHDCVVIPENYKDVVEPIFNGFLTKLKLLL